MKERDWFFFLYFRSWWHKQVSYIYIPAGRVEFLFNLAGKVQGNILSEKKSSLSTLNYVHFHSWTAMFYVCSFGWCIVARMIPPKGLFFFSLSLSLTQIYMNNERHSEMDKTCTVTSQNVFFFFCGTDLSPDRRNKDAASIGSHLISDRQNGNALWLCWWKMLRIVTLCSETGRIETLVLAGLKISFKNLFWMKIHPQHCDICVQY